MIKKFSALLLAMFLFAGVAMAGAPEAFEMFEDFENADSFAAAGWLTTGDDAYTTPSRTYGLDAGVFAKSGEYVLYSMDQMGSERNEMIYTPMMKLAAGKEATISFYLYTPGGAPATTFYSYVEVKAGTAQTTEAQNVLLGATSSAYAEWTELKYLFTPEADGDYCFSIALKQSSQLSRDHGFLALDDVLITGYTPGEGPDLEVESYEVFENFDNETNFAAAGWLTTGDDEYATPSRTKGVDAGVIAKSGEYVLYSMDQLGSERNEMIYTPMMTMVGGKEASISFYLYTPGGTPATTFYSYVEVKAGTAQTAEAQTVALGATSAAYADWTELKYLFIPEADGEYCFSIALKQSSTLSRDHGLIAIDDVTITAYKPVVTVVDPIITITPEVDTLDEALLGREYEVIVNVKATDLVDDIVITNITAGDYRNDVVPTVNIIAKDTAMSETGYDLVLKVSPSVLGRASVILEFTTTNVAEPTYYMLQWSATSGMELLDPNSDNYPTAFEAPYFNTFDNYDDDYDGSTVVPKGWATVGSYPFFTAALNGLNAVTGTYYLIADESALDERDDRLYTPFFRLSADIEYTVSYYLYMPGNSGGGVLRATNMQVTVGTEQDFDFHPVTLQTVVGESIGEWEKQEFTFKPQISGAYCFAFTLHTDVNYSGLVAIEDFNITAPGLVNRPTANFAFGGLFEIMDSKMLVFENQKVKLTNLSTDGETYVWEVLYPDGTTYLSDLENPEFEFNMSGEYTVTLTTTNVRDSRTTTRSVMVEYINYKSESLTMMTWNPSQDALMERGSIPAFTGEGNEEYDYDYVTGYNRYYHKLAERYAVPEGTELNISVITTWMAHYKNCAYSWGYDGEKPFEVVFYGETDGKLDETKEFARITTRLQDVFGTSGIGSGAGEGRTINLVELYGRPVHVEGTFYVALEFAHDMTITAYDPNIGRSYFATNAVKHSTEEATLYVKPVAVPANSKVQADGNWYPVDMLDKKMKGMGSYFVLWMNNLSGETAINAFGEVVFAVRLDGGNLIVSGTQEGETVRVFDANGMLVATATGRENSTIVPVQNLNAGVYFVNTVAGTSKFVK